MSRRWGRMYVLELGEVQHVRRGSLHTHVHWNVPNHTARRFVSALILCIRGLHRLLNKLAAHDVPNVQRLGKNRKKAELRFRAG